ncbi:MAG: hypothetical protein JWM05_2553 [Acidimicrobiales bacterium]|nr:hypothetical protein [Acidimicrobiales bacterium]
MTDIDKLIAVRLIAEDYTTFERMVGFYTDLLGADPYLSFGDATAVHAGAFFHVGPVDLVLAFETEVTPEARIDQGPAWLCFGTGDPAAVASSRSIGLSEVVDTSFGTRATFANDPGGFAVYVGSDWRQDGEP